MQRSLADMSLFSDEFISEHIYSIQTLGFNLIGDFLDIDYCSSLKKKLMLALENYRGNETPQSALDAYHIHDLLAQDILFARLLEDPRLQQLISPFLDNYWICYAFTSSSVPPFGENYGKRIHVDCPRFVPSYTFNMGLIWVLDDFTPQNGGTKLLPASHHSSFPPTEKYFEENCKQVSCKAGTLIVFNARVFHCSALNNTNKWRHSLTMNACRPFMKQRMDWVRLIPTSITNQLNQQAKRIIGYDTRLPTSLAEFFVPEEHRLYKAFQE